MLVSKQDVGVYVCAKSLQSCPTLRDAVDYTACQALLSTGSPGKNTRVGCCALSSKGSSRPRDRTLVFYIYLHWQAGSLPLVPSGKPTLLFKHRMSTKKARKRTTNLINGFHIIQIQHTGLNEENE